MNGNWGPVDFLSAGVLGIGVKPYCWGEEAPSVCPPWSSGVPVQAARAVGHQPRPESDRRPVPSAGSSGGVAGRGQMDAVSSLPNLCSC